MIVVAKFNRSGFYKPELDVLRLLAFLMVFLHHGLQTFFGSSRDLDNISGAFGCGLQLFFLLSSYLITELLLREREKTGTVHIPSFFTRRILRIWPLYFFFIGMSLAISKITSYTILTTPEFFAYLFLAGNWWTALHGFIPTIAGPLWSISIEEQFYLVWPFVLRFGTRFNIWVTSMFFIMLATIALYYLGHQPRRAVWCNSFVEFQFFATGAILALLLHNRTFALRTWLRPILFIAAFSAIFIAQSTFHVVADYGIGPGALLTGYGLLTVGVALLFLSFFNMKLNSTSNPLVFLGRISYGLYVFHDLSIRLVFRVIQRIHMRPPIAVIGAFIFCVCVASISYRVIELPFLHLKRRFTFVASRVD